MVPSLLVCPMPATFKRIDGTHTVDATQIIRETFDGPQPNAACLIGVVYDTEHHTAMVPTQHAIQSRGSAIGLFKVGHVNWR